MGMTQSQTLPDVNHLYPTTSWSAKLGSQEVLHDCQRPAQGVGENAASKLTF